MSRTKNFQANWTVAYPRAVTFKHGASCNAFLNFLAPFIFQMTIVQSHTNVGHLARRRRKRQKNRKNARGGHLSKAPQGFASLGCFFACLATPLLLFATKTNQQTSMRASLNTWFLPGILVGPEAAFLTQAIVRLNEKLVARSLNVSNVTPNQT